MSVRWKDYEFIVFEYDWLLSLEVAGLYVFASPEPSLLGTTRWRPWYVGETHSYATRLPNHEKWLPAKDLGATHVLVLPMMGEENRKRIEDRMKWDLFPPLNYEVSKPDPVLAPLSILALGRF